MKLIIIALFGGISSANQNRCLYTHQEFPAHFDRALKFISPNEYNNKYLKKHEFNILAQKVHQFMGKEQPSEEQLHHAFRFADHVGGTDDLAEM